MQEDKVALIVAAGSGIGAGVSRELSQRGYQVALLSPSGSAKKLAESLGGVGLDGSADHESDIEDLVQLAMNNFGHVDVVFSGTGHAPGSVDHTGRRFDVSGVGNLLNISDEDWNRAFNLYFLNMVRIARIVTPFLLKNDSGGAIVNLSASAAQEPSFAYPTSSTVRRALSGFAKLYADRYGKFGIRMNNVLPGYLNNWEWPEELSNNTPLLRLGTIDEVAKVVAFLLSDDASFITGQDILVDGGFVRKV